MVILKAEKEKEDKCSQLKSEKIIKVNDNDCRQRSSSSSDSQSAMVSKVHSAGQ